MKVNKLIIPTLVSLGTWAISFATPIFFKWYDQVNNFTGKDSMYDFLPFIMTVCLYTALVALNIYLWTNAFNKTNQS